MAFLRALSVLGLTFALAEPLWAIDRQGERDPLSETAHYMLDKSAARTSNLITEGRFDASVTRAVGEDEGGPAYEVNLDYNLNILFVGRKKGSQAMNVEQAFFTPEFVAELRTRKEYSGPSFNIRHLGFADARTMDGKEYPQCDQILIYDIKMGVDAAPFINLAAGLLATAASGDQALLDDPDFAPILDDMKITALIAPGVPVLGAVKIDLTGKYSGIAVKAGADYKAP